MQLFVHTDGASRGNPGPASIGYIIRDETSLILHQEGKRLGITTNNVAEYSAVLKALEYIHTHYQSNAPHTIIMLMDSQLVARQLSGIYKIKNTNLKPFFDAIKVLELSLGQVLYKHIPRDQNFIADRLANKALDSND